MIRKACIEDLAAILSIVNEVKVRMHEVGNYQWNDAYPVSDDFYNDISRAELFVDSSDEGVIKSFICLNQIQPPEYATADWSLDQDALVIHRMAVNPQYQRLGLAQKLMSFTEEKAMELGLSYIRSDTNSLNTGMNSLFRRSGYSFTGNINFPSINGNFNCYEKLMS